MLAIGRAYYELCKPRVVTLMLITAVVGMYLATPDIVPIQVLLFGTLGIGLAGASAATINHVADRHIDALMGRTRSRPIPTGEVSPRQALIFAAILGLIAMVVLITFVNVLTAVLSLITLVGYAGFYTLYLKRATPQNIVIGGLAGAAPPLLGWTAVTGQIDPHSLLLVLIIFVWTPPHFWALAIHREKEYAKAGIPMLPVTHGIAFTKLSILLYTLLLLVVSILPFVTGMSGLIYFVGAILLGLGFLYHALLLMYGSDKAMTMRTFHYSIFYLGCLFVLMLIDHYFN